MRATVHGEREKRCRGSTVARMKCAGADSTKGAGNSGTTGTYKSILQGPALLPALLPYSTRTSSTPCIVAPQHVARRPWLTPCRTNYTVSRRLGLLSSAILVCGSADGGTSSLHSGSRAFALTRSEPSL